MESGAEPGFVELTADGFQRMVAAQRGQINIGGDSRLNVTAAGGGDIAIYGQDLTVAASDIFAGIGVRLGNPTAQAGDIDINMTGAINFQPLTHIRNTLEPGSQGAGGNITIQGRNVEILNTGIAVTTQGTGQSGNLLVEATETLNIVGDQSLPDLLGPPRPPDNSPPDNSPPGGPPPGGPLSPGGPPPGGPPPGGPPPGGPPPPPGGPPPGGPLPGGPPPPPPGSSPPGGGPLTAGTLPLFPGTFLVTIGVTADSGNLTLQGQTVDIRGPVEIFSEIRNPSLEGPPLRGGDIGITAETFSVTGLSFISAAVFSGLGNGGNIDITAQDITLDKQGISPSVAGEGLVTSLRALTRGSSGDINITTDRLRILDGFRIISGIDFGASGRGGDITINARESIDIFLQPSVQDTFPTGIAADLRGESQGQGGNIEIKTPLLRLENGGEINASTFADGQGGDILIEAESIFLSGALGRLGPSRIVSISGNAADGRSGPGGNIVINTKQLQIRDGGQISAATFSDQEGGSLQVNAEQILIRGSAPAAPVLFEAELQFFVTNDGGDRFPSGLFASSPGTGNVASDRDALRIQTQDLRIEDGAQISVSSANAGAAGNLRIGGERLYLNNGTISADTVEGDDANITLLFRDEIRLNNSRISTNASGSANGGNLFIDPILFILENGSILSAENSGGSGNGGNITLIADFLVALPGATNQIIANAFAGSGGNINITTNAIYGDPFLDISASSQLGVDGTVTLETPEVDPVSSLGQLPTTVADLSNQIVAACGTDDRHHGPHHNEQNGQQNRLVATGRGGIGADPRHFLRSQIPIDSYLVAQDPLAQPLTQTDLDLNLTIDQAQAQDLFAAGQFATALAFWQAVETRYQERQDDRGILLSQIHQAQALQALGWHRRARVQLQRVNQDLAILSPELPSAKAQGSLTIPDLTLKALALKSLGLALQATGDLDQAQARLEQSLALTKQWVGDEADEADGHDIGHHQTDLLFHLGNTARLQQDFDQAHQFYNQAIALTQDSLIPDSLIPNSPPQQIQHHIHRQARLNQLSLYLDQGNLAAAMESLPALHPLMVNQPRNHGQIYQLINFAESLRRIHLALNSDPTPLPTSQTTSRTTSLDPAHLPPLEAIAQTLAATATTAATLANAPAQTYALGQQARIYEQLHQWDKALALTYQALKISQQHPIPEASYQWLWQLGRVLSQQDRASEAIAAYREAINLLDRLRQDLAVTSANVQFSFRDRVEPVYRQLVSLLLQPQDLLQPQHRLQPQNLSQDPLIPPAHLREARQLIENLQLAEMNDYFQDNCTTAQPIAADHVDPKAAVIYPILLADRLDVIVSISDRPLLHHSVSITPDQVQTLTQQLLRALTTPLDSAQPETLAQLQTLYQWLIAPQATTLDQAQIETLVFVADGPLRTLPLAALHHGQGYLVQDYNVVSSPGLELLDPRPLPSQDLQLLAGGLSEARGGFAPLPFVEQELQQVVSLIPHHRLYLNETLTTTNLAMDQRPSEVVHLATHGQFGSSADETFILTWDGQLTIGELGQLLQRKSTDQNPIELLVLSACETATGDSRAVLGIAGMAIRSNARSVMAGLWPLNDQATALFMGHFYQALAKPGMTKSQAFRQAQLALLGHDRFAAPFYWSPYVLVGNWL